MLFVRTLRSNTSSGSVGTEFVFAIMWDEAVMISPMEQMMLSSLGWPDSEWLKGASRGLAGAG